MVDNSPPPPPPGWSDAPTGGQLPPPPPGGYEAPPNQPPAPGAYEPLPHQPPAPGAYQPSAPGAYEPPAPGAYQPPPHQPPAPGAYQPPPPGAPAGYSHPNWAPPPPPKRSSGRRVWIIVASVLGVLVLGMGACTVWFVGTVKAPVDEANRFLAAIDAGDYAAAAARTDPACNQGMTGGQLEGLFAGADITYDLTSSSVTNNSATVTGSFSATDLSLRNIEVYLRKDGVWRVCGFNAT